MSQYQREELRMINEVLLALFLIANYSLFLYLSNEEFPWYALVGASVGLSIIIYCWTETKYITFIITLMICTIAYSVIYNWGTIFSLH